MPFLFLQSLVVLLMCVPKVSPRSKSVFSIRLSFLGRWEVKRKLRVYACVCLRSKLMEDILTTALLCRNFIFEGRATSSGYTFIAYPPFSPNLICESTSKSQFWQPPSAKGSPPPFHFYPLSFAKDCFKSLWSILLKCILRERVSMLLRGEPEGDLWA